METTTPAAERGTDTAIDASAPDGSGPAGPASARPLPAEELDRRYQALSDPKRRRILALLREGERCVCELVEALDVGQSLLSFHLKTLKEAELVEDRRDGRWVHYRARPEALAELRSHLRALAPGDGAWTGGDGGAGEDAHGRGSSLPPSSTDELEESGGTEEPYRCC